MTDSEPRRWDLSDCVALLREFRDERDWERFHNPKDLAAALAIEAAELQEIFLWKTTDEANAAASDPEVRRQINSELADVVIYALYLADSLGTDLRDAIVKKVARNAERF